MAVVSPTRYRVIFLLLGVALALVVVFAVVGTPAGREFELPPAVEDISPGNDETVLRQIDLRIDMQVGYTIELFIDGVRIPEREIRSIEATGVYIWEPGPSRAFAEWAPGAHSVGIIYERTGADRVDVGSLSWVFRVQ